MLFDTKTAPTRKELLLDLAAFGCTFVAAVVQDWKATDIVWASWITSLLLGFSVFVVLSLKKLREYAVAVPDAPKPMEGNPGCLFVVVGGFIALLAWFAGPGPVRYTLLALVALSVIALVVGFLAPRGWLGVSLRRPVVRAFFFLPTSLFMVFFFLMHFGGFHLGHAFVLSFFVPPEVSATVTADSVFADPMTPDYLAVDSLVEDSVAGQTEEPADFAEAWADLREGLVDGRGALFAFLGLLILTYWPYIVSVSVKSFAEYNEALMARSKKGEEMLLPYKYVIRVHLLIFVLLPLAALGSGILITLTVLVFFFFPVESVVAWAKNR